MEGLAGQELGPDEGPALELEIDYRRSEHSLYDDERQLDLRLGRPFPSRGLGRLRAAVGLGIETWAARQGSKRVSG